MKPARERLHELQKLLDEKLVSQLEYDDLRKRILDQLANLQQPAKPLPRAHV